MKVRQLQLDIQKYKQLRKKLNPNNDKFIIVEPTDDWREFNRLTIKLAPLIANGIIPLQETKLF